MTTQPDTASTRDRAPEPDLTDRAIEAYEQGDNARSLKLAEKAMQAGPEPESAARLIRLFRALDQGQSADRLVERTLEVLEEQAETAPDDAMVLGDISHLFYELDRLERAEEIARRANKLGDSNGMAERLLLQVLLERKDVGEALTIWEGFLNNVEDQLNNVLFLAKALGHYGWREEAIGVLEASEGIFANHREVYDENIAALRGQESARSQSESAAERFDAMSAVYDKNLKAIGNAGPQLIGRMLGEIGLDARNDLEVLDAGCGSGLCAPYLHQVAKHVHGCDVSVGMLELCKSKGLYHLLTRTDLGTRATYPDGPFDLVVSGDVFVYFGDLLDVFRNISDVLKPGGWFIFTVEDCTAEAPSAGHLVRSSGRHAHALPYLSDTLAKAGFARPKAEFAEVLRYEFRQPVHGRAVAAQKLAVFGAG